MDGSLYRRLLPDGLTRSAAPASEGGREASFILPWLLVGLVIRALFLAAAIATDTIEHFNDEYKTARALVAGQGYAFDYYGLFGSQLEPSTFFPPAYVYNVYVLLALFKSNIAIFVENLLLSLAVALLLYRLGLMLFDRTTARVALVLGLLYPPFFIRLTHGSPVYFKMFFMVAVVVALQLAWRSRGVRDCVLAGVLAGLLTLSMPDTLAYVGLISVAFAARERFAASGLKLATAFAVTTVLVVSPWIVRNWIVFDKVGVISTNGGFNLYMGNNPDTDHEVQYANIKRLDRDLGGELTAADEFERDEILVRESLEYIENNPLTTIGNMVERALLHWTFRPNVLSALLPGSGRSTVYVAYSWLYLLSYIPLLALGVTGLILSRKHLKDLGPLLLTFLYSTGIAALFIVQTKMRLIKVEPFLILFAAYALTELWQRRKRMPVLPTGV